MLRTAGNRLAWPAIRVGAILFACLRQDPGATKQIAWAMAVLCLLHTEATAAESLPATLWHDTLDRLQAFAAKAPPALALGLGVVLLVPALALGGTLFRVLNRRARRGAMAGARPTDEMEPAAWPVEAWLEMAGDTRVTDGGGARRFALDRPLTRIGREDDNEIRLDEATVHRYHAAIARDGDENFRISDLGGASGNGVRVNGQRVGQAFLDDGDLIALGRVVLTFRARPVDATMLAASNRALEGTP